MTNIIRLEDGQSGNLYAYIGEPFESFELAEQWLEERGFKSIRPNLWEREGKVKFQALGHETTVTHLRAFVEFLKTPEEVSFQIPESKESAPNQSQEAAELFKRIDAIIELIPEKFPERLITTKELRGRQHSVRFCAPSAVPTQWQAVGAILENRLPDPDQFPWAQEIATLFREEF